MKNYDSVFIKSNGIQIIKIIVILIILALTAFSTININTYMTSILDTQNEIEIKTKELQIKNVAMENYNSNKILEKSLESSVLVAKEKINPYPTIQNDIIKLDSILSQNNLATIYFKIGNVDVYDFLTESQTNTSVYYATVNITAQGDYYNILAAYNEIINNERWYDIKSVSFTSKEIKEEKIRLNTIFNIYFMERALPSSEKTENYNLYNNENPFK